MAQRNPSSRGRGLVPAVTLALAVLLQSSWCGAGLEGEMGRLFNSMANVTGANYHEGMGRGTVTGPSIAVRNPRVRADLINFVPPSINAGCGGIDMFLGSFSFIDAEHFVNLLQAIASNAGGYAFKMALKVMCPTCMETMDKLQSAIQALNALAGDSCKIAKHGVDFLAKELDLGALEEHMKDGPISTLAQQVGTGADAFKNFLNQLNEGSPMEDLNPADIVAMMGNVAWKVMQREGFMSSAFMEEGGNDMAEALMSLTGTLVGVKGLGDSPDIRPYEKILSVKSTLEGNHDGHPDGPKKYKCLNGECTEMERVPFIFEGLEYKVNKTLLGADLQAGDTGSFIYKLLTNTGNLTPTEISLIRMAPYHMARLRNMAVCAGPGNMGSAPQYALKAARLIALEVLQTYLRDVVTSISKASQGLPAQVDGHPLVNTLVPRFQADLREAQKELNQEARALQGDLPVTLETMYQGAVANCNLKQVSIDVPTLK